MTRAVCVLVCLLLTACGTDGGEPARTMTERQAAQRAQEHIDRAVAALPQRPTLTVQDDSSTECLDPTDGGPRGRYEVGRTYWLDGLPADRNGEFVDALHRHWVDSDFRVLTDQRSAENRFVSVENNGDAFRMSVKQSVEGSLSLGASSPCVWPDGVPPDDVG